MLPLTGDIKEGVTYIRRDGSECTVVFKHNGDNLFVSHDEWFYGPVGDSEQYYLHGPDRPQDADIIGIKQ
ncbi:hypothetical protein D3C87_324860 [compost metagenome]